MKTPEDNNRTPMLNNGARRYWIWYLVAFLLIGGFIWLFVSNFSTGVSRSFRNPDMHVVEVDPDGVANTGDEYEMKGELYQILESSEVISLQEENHSEAGYKYIVGSYRENIAGSTGYTVVSFEAVLTLDDSEAIQNYTDIIGSRTGIKYDTNNNAYVVLYYGTDGFCSYNIVDYTNQSSWTDYLPTIIIWGLVIALGIFLVSRLFRSMNSAMSNMNSQTMNFNSSRAKRETMVKVRFADVAGCDEVKAELVELVDYFKNASKYTKLGAKLPKGFLLVGPPGTGKTLLAKAVAGEAHVPFYSISGSDFVEMYVGVGAGRVRDMFKTAKQNAPCLIFIDEIDAVGRQRGAGLGGGNDEREQTLNQLLVEMDGFEENSGVIVMAATNRADVLDPALTRAGRFDRQITVDLPDKEGREAILKVHARNKIVAKSVDFGAIASRTVGFSGADLANILNDAAILAVRQNKNEIDTDDIDEAIDRSIAGPAKTNRGMSEEEKRRVAYHESGHAIIGIRLQHSEKVQRITIIPRGRTGGHVLMTPENDRFLLTKDELIAQITGLLGGRTSEEIFFGDVSTGASNDIEQATRIARMMVTEYGMSELGPIQYEHNTGSVFLGRDYTSQQANYSTQIAYEIDKAVRDIIDQAHENCRKLLEQYRDDVELVAKTLLEKETITAEEIEYLMEHRELPPKKVVETPKEEGDTTSNEEANKETKTEEIQRPLVEGLDNERVQKFDKKANEFLSELNKIKASDSVAIIILCVESKEDGKDLTFRKLRKIATDAGNAYVQRIIALGETPSDKIKQGLNIACREEVWKQFKDDVSSFGQFVEDYTGAEVVLVKSSSKTIDEIKKNLDMMQGGGSSDLSEEAKEVNKDLKDLVNKSSQNKDDENKK